MTERTVAVVIPFFQREAGILARALNSVAAQTVGVSNLHVYIVDDTSPVSAQSEVDAFSNASGLRITILRQQNQGPNTARNTGLDSIPVTTQFVAYLDSDDAWLPNHIERGIRALSAGYDVYFSNLRHLGADGPPEFERAGRLDIASHPPIPSLSDPTLRAYEGDMAHQVITANTMFIPTMMVNAQFARDVRFFDGYRNGGGDYLYWLRLAKAGATFCFSTECEVHCGAGINMWYSNGWGTDGYLKRLLGEAQYRSRALNELVTGENTRLVIPKQLSQLRIAVVHDTLHRMKRRKPIDWALLRKFRHDIGLGAIDVVHAFTRKA